MTAIGLGQSVRQFAGKTIPGVLLDSLRAQPSAIALELVDGPSYTWERMMANACTLSAGLKRIGLTRGDRLVLLLPNSYEAVLGWLAAALAGAIEVSINTAYTGALLEHAINRSRARFLIVTAEHLRAVRESLSRLEFIEKVFVIGPFSSAPVATNVSIIPFETLLFDVSEGERDIVLSDSSAVRPFDAASIMYTSGTSGPAKGVIMPHAQICVLAAMTARQLQLCPSVTFYCTHPLFHMAGKFMATLGTLLSGGRLVLDKQFRAEHWLDTVRRYGATRGLAHGPMIEMLYQTVPRPNDAENPMELLLAAPFPARIKEGFERRFGIRHLECWGMTEVGVPLWQAPGSDSQAGCCGRADEELFDVRVIKPQTDEPLPVGECGELVVRPKVPWLLMQGYDGLPDTTLAAWRNLWFHSGDFAYQGENGDFFFVDRVSDRIRRRAENISSSDIEVAALACGATEAAAVGVPSEYQGDDDIKLCVVVENWSPTELLEALARLLPPFMLPRYIERFGTLPRSATNKIRKSELRSRGVTESVWDRKKEGIVVRNFYV